MLTLLPDRSGWSLALSVGNTVLLNEFVLRFYRMGFLLKNLEVKSYCSPSGATSGFYRKSNTNMQSCRIWICTRRMTGLSCRKSALFNTFLACFKYGYQSRSLKLLSYGYVLYMRVCFHFYYKYRNIATSLEIHFAVIYERIWMEFDVPTQAWRRLILYDITLSMGDNTGN